MLVRLHSFLTELLLGKIDLWEALYVIALGACPRLRVFFNCRYAFFPRCFTVLDVYEVNNVYENDWVWVPGVVTWEHFLEALSERFRWVLGSCLNEVSSAVHLNK